MSIQTGTQPSLQLTLQELSSKNEELKAIRGENLHLQQKCESAFQENLLFELDTVINREKYLQSN